MGNFVNHMVFVPTFTHPEISGVTFGGFMVGKYQASQPNATPDDDNPDVADSADPAAVPAITQPGVAPWRYITFHQARKAAANLRSEEHTSELQSQSNLVCRLLLEKK